MNQYPLLFGNYPGEVVGISEGSGEQGPSLIKYDVLVSFTNGSKQLISGVRTASMFGGIGDTFQVRLQTTDDIQKFNYKQDGNDDKAYNATTGARVIITFMAGHINYPLIIGYLNHPNGIRLYENHADLDPQSELVYLGMTFRTDEDGQFEIVHRGAPTVSYKKSPGIPNLSAISSLTDDDPSATPDNAALEPADDTETVRMKWLKGGAWRLNDAVGQMIEMDMNKNRIYISNNDLKSTDAGPSLGPQIATNDTDAEYILLDRDKELVLINARSIIQLYSFGDRKDVTEGDHKHHVLGDEKILVDGDKTDTYGGAWEYTVETDLSPTVHGDYDLEVTGSVTTNSDGDTDLSSSGSYSISSSVDMDLSASNDFSASSGGATITMNAAGQIGIKGNMGEVLDLISQILQAIQQLTVPTSPGGGTSGPPINIADFVQLQAMFDGMKA